VNVAPDASLAGLTGSQAREERIAAARRALQETGVADASLPAWIGASWRRCLGRGQRPDTPVHFDLVTRSRMRAVRERSTALMQAAVPVIAGMRQAMQSTGYFAILTDRDGVVVAVDGPIDRRDRRADVIARVGVDLSEDAVGTTAIGAALAEQVPVWLHRGEHFFAANGVYSCAGAPIYDARGELTGMLDLTGVCTVERPGLRHLVAAAAHAIETRSVLAVPHALSIALYWPGLVGAATGVGWLAVDSEGGVRAFNRVAREMLAIDPEAGLPHLSNLFAMQWQRLFDLADGESIRQLPLWSGLVVSASVQRAGSEVTLTAMRGDGARPLRELETALIRRTVSELRGNVKAAAAQLGISRATIYRKLGRRSLSV